MSYRRTGTIIGLLVFTFFLLIYFFSFGNVDFSALKAINYQLLFFLALIHIFSILFHTFAAWLLLHRVHSQSRLSQVYLALTSSLAVGYFLPGKLGLPARVYLYHRLFGLTVGASFGLVAWEIAVTILIPLVFSIPGLWMFYPQPWLFPLVLFLIFLIPSLVLVGFFLRHHGAKIRWLYKIRCLFSPLSPFVEGLTQTLRSLDLRTIALFSLFCFFVLLCSVWFSQLLLLHLGSPVSPLSLLSIQSLSYLAGVISLMPMGLGARELSLVVLLGKVGVPADIATYAALIQRVIATGLSFFLGLISMRILWLNGSLREFKQSQKV